MRHCLFVGICLVKLHIPVAQAIELPMSATDWEVSPETTFERREGFPSGIMTLPRGLAVLKGASFSNGTIELDLKALEFSDTGIQFRRRDGDFSEFVYVRADPDCPAANDCIQYAPITHGLMQWDLYPRFQAQAPISEKGWNHLKIVVAGSRMQVYVNREQIPSLSVDRLQGLTDSGGIALKGPAAFANLMLRADDISGLQNFPKPVARDRHTVPAWQVSSPVPMPAENGPLSSVVPSTVAWRRVPAESDGLVNLSREFGPTAEPALVWLKTRVSSHGAQEKSVHLGWARQVWLFVNDQLIYSAENPYYPEEARLGVDGRFEPNNATVRLPLRDGNNEILVAVGNRWRTHQGTVKASPYGWGVAMSFVGP